MILHTDTKQSEKALSSLLFISLPSATAKAMGSLITDPSVLLPIETAGAAIRGSLDSRAVTPEALVAGMLRLLAWNPGHKHAAYYRSIILAVRPDLLSELLQAGVAKAGEREWGHRRGDFPRPGWPVSRCPPSLFLTSP